MPYIDLPDTQLYYDIDDYTDPWRTPKSVLMIHGFTESTPAWRRWVPGLARDYRVIRYDQLGFGQSAPAYEVRPRCGNKREGFGCRDA